MITQSPSQIFKAVFRGHEEDENYRCLSTFTTDEYKKSFGKIKKLNDETLAPQITKSFLIEEDTEVIILPLYGTVSLNQQEYINTEEIRVLKLAKGNSFELQNPYEKELINYLQIRFSTHNKNTENSIKKTFDFETRNTLFTIHDNGTIQISIGIFDGRSEGLYHLNSKNNGAFAFIINGAFEFQNRLLETRDGLSIWDISEIEFEALSENAILLLIETTLQE